MVSGADRQVESSVPLLKGSLLTADLRPIVQTALSESLRPGVCSASNAGDHHGNGVTLAACCSALLVYALSRRFLASHPSRSVPRPACGCSAHSVICGMQFPPASSGQKSWSGRLPQRTTGWIADSGLYLFRPVAGRVKPRCVPVVLLAVNRAEYAGALGIWSARFCAIDGPDRGKKAESSVFRGVDRRWGGRQRPALGLDRSLMRC